MTQEQPIRANKSATYWAFRSEIYAQVLDYIASQLVFPMAQAEQQGQNWQAALPDPDKAAVLIATLQTLADTVSAFANTALAMRLTHLRPTTMPEIQLPPMPPFSGPGSSTPEMN